ncbi:MAG: SIS domain-containing protein [Actinobacteria bacterium]|nr:SIS domain-containing protein [Actinomycetota bacterium]
MTDRNEVIAAALSCMLIEAHAIENAADTLGPQLLEAIELISRAEGRVLVSGLGKSGLVGAKIAATLASTGTPAHFVHAGEALHGDSGVVTKFDVAILISNSGETTEVCRFASMLAAWQVPVIAMTARSDSTLARSAQVVLDLWVEKEGDPLGLAPTASTAVTLALGDALAVGLMTLNGFTTDDFAARHPGGALGAALTGGEP